MTMKPCATCGREYRYSVSDAYRYAESGIDNIYLTNVEIVTCECGESVVLQQHPSMLRILASCFAYKPARIRGPEVRFIRNVLGKKAKDFAESLSVRAEHLSRIENSGDCVSESLDKLIRFRLIIELQKNHGQLMAETFDIDEFFGLTDKKLPADDGRLALFVSYRGSYIGADDSHVEFEFREAA